MKVEEKALGEVITLQRGFDLPYHARRHGSVPIVSSAGISGWHDEAPLDGPGVVTGRYGTIGQVFFLDGPYWPHNTTLWVKDFKGSDPHFIYYLLKTVDYSVANSKTGVLGVDRNDLHRILVTVPEPIEQRRIARILGSLDDKIELNRRMNATLEEMARAIFKAWFVDFLPVKAKAAGATSFPGMPPKPSPSSPAPSKKPPSAPSREAGSSRPSAKR